MKKRSETNAAFTKRAIVAASAGSATRKLEEKGNGWILLQAYAFRGSKANTEVLRFAQDNNTRVRCGGKLCGVSRCNIFERGYGMTG